VTDVRPYLGKSRHRPASLEITPGALRIMGLILFPRPASRYPANVTVEDMEDLYVEHHGDGRVANLTFTTAPMCSPDGRARSDAPPVEDQQGTRGAERTTGSLELPLLWMTPGLASRPTVTERSHCDADISGEPRQGTHTLHRTCGGVCNRRATRSAPVASSVGTRTAPSAFQQGGETPGEIFLPPRA
jgi:hypothetical protein